jgi:hypothetical protein
MSYYWCGTGPGCKSLSWMAGGESEKSLILLM